MHNLNCDMQALTRYLWCVSSYIEKQRELSNTTNKIVSKNNCEVKLYGIF